MSWIEAARFVNWLNTSTGNMPAYKFNGGSFELWTPADPGYDPNNLYRNNLAPYFLPAPTSGTRLRTTIPRAAAISTIQQAATPRPRP